MQTLSNRKDIIQFRYIRVIACLCIVLLHTLHAAGDFFAGSMSLTDMLVSRSAQNLLLWCVPCFLMVTGALLLDPEKEIPVKTIFSKYVLRMVLALVIFTFIFRIADALADPDAVLTFGDLVKQWIAGMLTGDTWLPMWYLYLMIGLYAMMPVYKIVFRHASDEVLRYLVLVVIFFVSIVPAAGVFGLDLAFYIPTSLIYPAYLFLGRMIYTGQIRVSRHMAVILAVGCSVILVMLTYYRYMYGDVALSEDRLAVFTRVLLGYPSVFVVGQPVGIFSLLCGIPSKREKAEGLLLAMDQCSFGIYLIHMIFVMIVMKVLMVDPYAYGGALLFIAMTGAFFALSFAVTFVLRKIPGVSRVL